MADAPRYILAPYVPTPHDVVERMLDLAQVANEDLVYDLGCGDGRIPIAAAQRCGARGYGVDIEPYWVAEARANAKRAGVADRVSFELQDALAIDLSPATVLMLYLVEWSTAKLQPSIVSTARVGTRIVSHTFNMTGWAPTRVDKFADAGGTARTLYLWVVDEALKARNPRPVGGAVP
jgi:SAM-dependent methyltransferase